MKVTATIKLIEGIDGDYGMHGQTGWDDQPYWVFFPAWIVLVQVMGKVAWGPVKFRRDAQKTHSGVADVELSSGSVFAAFADKENPTATEHLANQSAAEDLALSWAEVLEKNGFQPEIVFGKSEERQDVRHKLIWGAGAPGLRLQKQIRVGIEDLRP